MTGLQPRYPIQRTAWNSRAATRVRMCARNQFSNAAPRVKKPTRPFARPKHRRAAGLVAGALVSALASPQGCEPYLLIVYKAWGEPRKGVLHLEGVFPEIQLGLGSGLGLRVGLGLG